MRVLSCLPNSLMRLIRHFFLILFRLQISQALLYFCQIFFRKTICHWNKIDVMYLMQYIT